MQGAKGGCSVSTACLRNLAPCSPAGPSVCQLDPVEGSAARATVATLAVVVAFVAAAPAPATVATASIETETGALELVEWWHSQSLECRWLRCQACL